MGARNLRTKNQILYTIEVGGIIILDINNGEKSGYVKMVEDTYKLKINSSTGTEKDIHIGKIELENTIEEYIRKGVAFYTA